MSRQAGRQGRSQATRACPLSRASRICGRAGHCGSWASPASPETLGSLPGLPRCDLTLCQRAPASLTGHPQPQSWGRRRDSDTGSHRLCGFQSVLVPPPCPSSVPARLPCGLQAPGSETKTIALQRLFDQLPHTLAGQVTDPVICFLWLKPNY